MFILSLLPLAGFLMQAEALFMVEPAQLVKPMQYASFTTNDCNVGNILAGDFEMVPGKCYLLGDAQRPTSSSVWTLGLDTDADPFTYMKVFHDKECKNYETQIHFESRCMTIGGQSIMLVKERSFKRDDDAAAEHSRPRTRSVLDRRAGAGLANLQDTIRTQQQHAHESALKSPSMSRNLTLKERRARYEAKHQHLPRHEAVGILRRAPGDRHIEENGERESIEIIDDNEVGNPNGFLWRNFNQAHDFVRILIRNIQDYQVRLPHDYEYQGQVTMNSHNIDIQFTMANGHTIDSLDEAWFMEMLFDWLDYRQFHSHQIWNFYRVGQLIGSFRFVAKRYRNPGGELR